MPRQFGSGSAAPHPATNEFATPSNRPSSTRFIRRRARLAPRSSSVATSSSRAWRVLERRRQRGAAERLTPDRETVCRGLRERARWAESPGSFSARGLPRPCCSSVDFEASSPMLQGYVSGGAFAPSERVGSRGIVGSWQGRRHAAKVLQQKAETLGRVSCIVRAARSQKPEPTPLTEGVAAL